MNLRKEVELNVPMFVGVILIFAIVTAVSVYGVNQTKELMLKENQRIDQELDNVDDYFTNRFDETDNETNNQINNEINDSIFVFKNPRLYKNRK